jgi:FkbM family methyltransferase
MNDTRHKLIIDVGANDGFLSSNSYNLVRAGWDAVLFEPLPKNFNILKQLHEVIRKKENQMVLLRNFAIAPQDGTGFLKTKIADDASDMQGYLCSAEEADAVPVNTVSVGSLIENDADFSEVLNRAEYVILSIDVEGNDLDVLQAFLAAGITSHLIIIETFRFEQNTVNKLFELQGYRFIKTIHWNSIYAWGSI